MLSGFAVSISYSLGRLCALMAFHGGSAPPVQSANRSKHQALYFQECKNNLQCTSVHNFEISRRGHRKRVRMRPTFPHLYPFFSFARSGTYSYLYSTARVGKQLTLTHGTRKVLHFLLILCARIGQPSNRENLSVLGIGDMS